ncbi:trypsin-like serine protease [Euzebya sp.]|uniref:trypsin-like serine protease n=1 Tax=Euzebya sp. TaxID=1971409 RepID=UPI003514B97F
MCALALAVPAGAAEYAVVGGQPAEPGAWPSVVALVRAEEPDRVVAQFCGGTAIASDLVLTAAHCFHDDTAERWRHPEDIRVIAGRTELGAAGGIELAGSAVHLHPDYDPVQRRNDVAVLRVSGDLGVPPQPLVAEGADWPSGGAIATVLGWGRTGAGADEASATTTQLHAATVPVTDPGSCGQAFGGTLDLLLHLCAGGPGAVDAPAADSCRGDSGGPLLATDPADGVVRQVGVVSFGPSVCGVGDPGVYARLSTARSFVDGVVAGQVPPSVLPDTGPAPTNPAPHGEPVRIAATVDGPTTAIPQAVAASRAVFADGAARLAVVARDDGFPDALAGSTLAYGRGPLLYTPSTGGLDPLTRAELVRAVRPGATGYLLGGEAAVPAAVADELAALGFTPRRLAGDTREATAAAVAAEVVARHGSGPRPPFGTAILVTSGSWPDAVVAGQLAVWWGFPVLLTPPDVLHPATGRALADMAVQRVIVVGGAGAVSVPVVDGVRDLVAGATVTRLAGTDRTRTAIAVAQWHRAELAGRDEPAPDTVAAVNLRREDAYAHVLSAAPVVGAGAGVFMPVEGEAGDQLTGPVREAFCGAGGLPLVIGGTDLVSADTARAVGDVLAGRSCAP